MVRRESNAGPNLNAMGRAARISTQLGLPMLILTAASLITMPFTQHLWTWDRFLHGGQDFETGALVILTALNLVLVLAKCCKQDVGKLLTVLRRFMTAHTTEGSSAKFSGAIAAPLQRRVSVPDLSSFRLPLLI